MMEAQLKDAALRPADAARRHSESAPEIHPIDLLEFAEFRTLSDDARWVRPAMEVLGVIEHGAKQRRVFARAGEISALDQVRALKDLHRWVLAATSPQHRHLAAVFGALRSVGYGPHGFSLDPSVQAEAARILQSLGIKRDGFGGGDAASAIAAPSPIAAQRIAQSLRRAFRSGTSIEEADRIFELLRSTSTAAMQRFVFACLARTVEQVSEGAHSIDTRLRVVALARRCQNVLMYRDPEPTWERPLAAIRYLSPQAEEGDFISLNHAHASGDSALRLERAQLAFTNGVATFSKDTVTRAGKFLQSPKPAPAPLWKRAWGGIKQFASNLFGI